MIYLIRKNMVIPLKKINLKEIGLGFLIIFIYMFIIPELVVFLFNIFHLDLHDDFIYILASISIYILTMITLIVIYKRDFILDFQKFKEHRKEYTILAFKYWVALFIFMMLSNTIIISISGGIATNEAQNRIMISSMPFFSFISMAIFGPFIEEMLFRKGFKKAFQNDTVFCLFTSLLFGMAHIISAFTLDTISQNPLQLLFIIPYSGMGYFLAKAYAKTDTIYTSTLMHMIHNTIAVLFAMLGG